jgi:hypothetical protein
LDSDFADSDFGSAFEDADVELRLSVL